ncbi:MAG: ribosome biogenesis GTPase Der [Tissierellia bacterium]|nr:ribosome biogenesis GTPase Der [Tissierellia bacterium]
MYKPIVAVVGRPNVGKSTLFNKIVGKRISITEDTPGVTRDRIYSEGNWLGRDFILIDTGGLDIKSEDTFMVNIKNQADLAMDTADYILFVVDGKEGLTSLDREIASYLRKTNKEILLVINKFDAKVARENIYEFYELGFEKTFPISSEQGIGIGDLLDEVIKDIPYDEEEEDEESIRVSFIGKPNAGKSSLINYILGEKRVIVTDIPGTTRDSVDSYMTYQDTNYVFVDTAGLRKKKKINEKVERYSVVRTLSAIDRSKICVLIIDATQGVTEQDSKIAGYAHDNHKGLIIAVNKWDLINKDNKTTSQFQQEVRRVLPFLNYAPIVFISAKTGQRVEKLLQMIHLVNNNYNMRIQTGVLNDILNQAVLMNQPPSDKGRRGKLFYGSQVSVRPPRFALFVNDKDLFHFSYVRYLENQIREAFSFDGVPIILDLRNREKMYG